MSMKTNELAAWLLVLAYILFWLVPANRMYSVEDNYYLGLLMLCAFYALGIVKLFPFGSTRAVKIRPKELIAYFVLLGMPISCFNEMLDRGNPQFWYPSDHKIWSVLPVFTIVAIGSWFFGIGGKFEK